jgi:CBS domain-containing protein
MNINEIMSIDVKTCKPTSDLESVAGLMWRYDCGAIPVIDDENKPMGVITDRDIAMAAMLNHKPLWSLTSEDLLNGQKLCSCQQNDAVQDCLDKMKEHGVRRILVTNADGTLAGIVSIGDIVAFTGNSRAKGSKTSPHVSMAPVLGMLKRVSAHHMQPERPLADIQSSRKSTAN